MSGDFKTRNIFENIPMDQTDEVSEAVLDAGHMRIERIVSRGHASPVDFWYDQVETEYVLLLAGSAEIRFKDQNATVVMHPGDHITIPKHVKHRVEWTDPHRDTVWLAVFYQ